MRLLLTADAELPVPPPLYGGIERVIASLIEEFRRRGHQVGLVAHRDSVVETDFFQPWPGLTSTGRGDSLRNALALRRAAREFRPDLLHSFSRLLWLLALPAPVSVFRPLSSALRPLPLIMSYQREPSGRTGAISRRIHGPRLSFTACSTQLARKGEERGGGNWTAIPNFIDPSKLTFVPKVADDAPLVFLSRIEPIKGCHQAIAIAKASGRRLLIAGNRVETGSAAGYWDGQIAPHLGKNGIEYVGPVDDVQKNALLGQAAAMLVPIEWDEPFGIVFTEALACGTPVISCPRGALPEIVRDGVHGFLIQSIEEGTDAVHKLYQINRSACREQVEKHFTVQIVASRYLEIYQGLV
jgi:glycosyltransferase involved in cell wall biosynthesis